jgi:hypothetical protein
MSILCSIFGHKTPDITLDKPSDNHPAPCIISCERCRYICSVWVWFYGHWNHFNR